jgi:hypothetical protein
LAVDEDQADAFSNDLQQLVQDPSDRPELKNTRLRPRTNGRVVALSHEIQECGSVNKKKKKSTVSFNNGIPTELKQEVEDEETRLFDTVSNHPSEPVPVPDPDPSPDPDTNPGVGGSEGDESSPNSGVNAGADKLTGLGNSFNPDGYGVLMRTRRASMF